MVPDYDIVLTYFFENASAQDIVKEVNVRLSAKNNTHMCGGRYMDGETTNIEIPIGKHSTIDISPEKFLYNKDVSKCRTRPYDEELETHLNNRLKNCQRPCLPPTSE